MKTIFIDEPSGGNLISIVANSLKECGLIKEANDVFLQAPVIVQAMSFNNERQRSALNRFFYSQLADLNVATQEPRYCLINDGTVDQWFKLFSTKIIPYCSEYRLPKRNWS